MPPEGDPGAQAAHPLSPVLSYSSKKSARRLMSWVRQLFGLKNNENSYQEALQEVLEDHAEELVRHSPEEGRMLSNLIHFGELEVGDIMIPQTSIIAADIGISLTDLYQLVIREQHTRIPIYEDNIDQIRGFLHIKDLMPLIGQSDEAFHLSALLREILFVPLGMKLTDLLLKMRVSGVHIAMVVDEYGGTTGLVTLEDLFEEIVGEIQDEHDEEITQAQLKWDHRQSMVVDARIRIEDLEQLLGMHLTDEEEGEDYDTLGGLIFAQLGRVPTKGESTQHASGLRLEIVDADARSIKKVRLFRKDLPQERVAG